MGWDCTKTILLEKCYWDIIRLLIKLSILKGSKAEGEKPVIMRCSPFSRSAAHCHSSHVTQYQTFDAHKDDVK